jgi:uncharacterized protein
MRSFLFVSLLLISNVLPAQQSNFIKDRPFTPHVVNDYGSFLSSSDERKLENELISFRKKKGYSIVIITLSTLTDNSGYTWSVEDAALQYFNKWGIGNKRLNDGVLILLSKDPRRVRIATGSGIESKLTDEVCQRIIDRTIVPEFKMGWYYTGLKEGVKDIESALTGWTSPGRTQNANTLHSGSTAPAADNWSTVEEPEQAQPQAQAQRQQTQPAVQPVSATERMVKQITPAQAIVGTLMLALILWLRVRWVNNNTSRNLAEGGSNASRSMGSKVFDYVKAFGWLMLWYLKIMWWVLLCCFGIFAIFFGINVLRGRSFSSGAGASFGGGKSSGGGATGSW